MLTLAFLTFTACIQDLEQKPSDFPDNPSDDYDQDGLSEFDGDCDDRNESIQGPSIWHVDSDGDGFGNPAQSVEACYAELLESTLAYVADGTDCDDDNPDINPDMQESCDGLDNDCSGEVDDYSGPDAIKWYLDLDQDGFGDPLRSIYACVTPPAYVLDGTDCDDSNADTYPNAPEYCDGVDSNCNDVLDDDSALDAPLWYTDLDGDGYGSPSTVVVACAQPSGFVGNATDCNDFSSEQHPGAEELCNQQDDNCDSQIDEGVLSAFYLDADGDGYGDVNQIVEACSVPAGAAENADDCNDGSALIRPDATEVCNNVDDNCDGDIDNDAVGTSQYYLDVDGDGHGTPSNSLVSCPAFDPNTGLPVAPAGYSLLDDDCDDGDASRSPSQAELCTETIDENCDGHNTIGATDVQQYIADSDGDGYGNDSFVLDFCYAPLGYIAYVPGDSVDCNDNDSEVNPSVPVSAEMCNGRLDSCDNQWDGISPPIEEIDEDGDGFVACVLDVPLAGWLGDSITDGADCDPLDSAVFPGNLPLESDPEGCYLDMDLDGFGDVNPPGLGAIVAVDFGTDCVDSEDWVYPGAPEDCNGVAEDCSDPLYPVPAQESDDDGDGYVECDGFDSATWEGDINVVGGSDCNDTSDFTFPGAAVNSPGVCAQDVDNDGDPDCNLTGIHPEYVCDTGVFPSVGIGPDFVLIPAGTDPLGRYSISFDFYMMTTEMSAGMWDSFMGGVDVSDLMPKDHVSWHDAALLSNALSAFGGKELCYSCTGSTCTEAVLPLTDCMGYRLPTEWEWEYAARSGTTQHIWTGEGPDLGGAWGSNGCTGNEVITDGLGTSLFDDYAWYCGNNDSNASDPKAIAQLLPNGFGLFDMHGNVMEWTSDWSEWNIIPSGADYWNSSGSSNGRMLKGGHYNKTPDEIKASKRYSSGYNDQHKTIGFRLVIRAP